MGRHKTSGVAEGLLTKTFALVGRPFFRRSDDPDPSALVKLSLPLYEHKMGLRQQLEALLYKDYVIRKLKRHYIASLLEILLPCSLIALVVYLKSQTSKMGVDAKPQWSGPDYYEAKGPYGRDDLYFYRFNVEPKNEKQLYRVLQKELATIIYTPKNPYTDKLMEAFVRENATREIKSFNNEKLMDDYLELNSTAVELAIVFDNTLKAGHLGYTLRFNSSRYHFHTNKRFNENDMRPRSSSLSFEEKHLLWPVMNMLFENHLAFYNFENQTAGLPVSPKMRLFPTPRYARDASLTAVSQFIPTLLSVGCIFFVVFFCKQIISDKQSRVRELLRMMGLSDIVYWLNLFCVGGITLGIVTAIATFCFWFNFNEVRVLTHSNPIIIFIVLIVFSISAILQILLITVLVNSPTLGAMLSMLVWFVSMLVSSVWMDPENGKRYPLLSAEQKMWSSMLPCSGLYWCFKLITFWEEATEGAQFSNLAKIAKAGDNITMLGILSMMVVSWFVYAFLIFYLDAVIPWQYGMPKSPFFLLKRSYWFPSCARDLDNVSTRHLLGRDSGGKDSEMFEKPPPNSGDPVVVLRDVTQVFGHKKAVDNLSLDLYRDQITVVLGHNGAGKTTTMNILTGLFPPTAGEMFINGYSVRENTKRARQGIGLCPQHNVLFDELTVNEHLWFFAKIKGAPSDQIESEIVQLLEKFNLTPKRYTMASGLSGGMKRKLCMANAMVGGSNILILDEPTAGMDPQARRGVWTILQEVRRSRTVLLTTHYMEEADVLGDRIAFLAAGKLKCAGSPMFLKKMCETGYNMRCAKVSPAMRPSDVMEAVDKHLGEGQAFLTADLGLEFCVNLGFPETTSLIKLFRYIEDHKAPLGIASLGVSVTTMEDVFLKVGEMDEIDAPLQELQPKGLAALEISERFPSFVRVHGAVLWRNQFCALLMKRINAIKRQWFMPIFMVLLPVVLMAAFCYLTKNILTPEQSEQVTEYLFRSLKGPQKETVGFIEKGLPPLFESSLRSALIDDGVQVRTVDYSETSLDEYLLRQASDDSSVYKDNWVMGASRPEGDEGTQLWFNGEPFHIGAAAIARWQTALLRQITNDSSASVNARNQPVGSQSENAAMLLVFLRFASLFPVSLASAFLTCSLVFFPVQERVSKAQLIQMMSGVHRIIFFGASFLFDLTLILVSSIFMVLICIFLNPGGSFTAHAETWLASWVVFFVYGFTMVPVAYLSAYFFKSASTGFTTLLCFSSITGGIIVLIMAILDLFSSLANNPFAMNRERIADALHLLNYVPPFSVVWGFTNVLLNGASENICSTLNPQAKENLCLLFPDVIKSCCHPCIADGIQSHCYGHETPFQFDIRIGAGFQIVAMLVTGTIAFALLMGLETNAQRFIYVLEFINWQRIRNFFSFSSLGKRGGGVPNLSSVTTEEDIDVTVEKENVTRVVDRGSVSSYALVAHELTKYYGSFKAVDDISFVVNDKECFGLLGVNGAGKTTTFGMLTGDLLMSAGNAYIKRSNLRTSVREFQGYIGYCPQFDALIETMTGREILELFCALRGVPTHQTREMVNFMIGVADLQEHANKPTGMYSGGNKRKLSIAIAMIGNPHVMFLDEPTAGVDPAARRKIWATLMQAQKEIGSAIILTSHSMEECQALCNRLCIMVNGSFRCLGSSQHLKSKFGQGFTVLIKLKSSADEVTVVPKVCATMDKLFPGENKLKDSHQCLLHFHVSDLSLRWSELFERIEYLKRRFDFEDVVVSDTTLEQIFLAFAKDQRAAQSDEGAVGSAKTKFL